MSLAIDRFGEPFTFVVTVTPITALVLGMAASLFLMLFLAGWRGFKRSRRVMRPRRTW